MAAAVGAARLYPPASALPQEALEKFVQRTSELTVSGPLRFIVEPQGFRFVDTPLAAGQSQVTALAEALHAIQVGQLVLAPGVSDQEVAAFVKLCLVDPAAVRRSGGARALLVKAGVTHIAVIEISLRASEESGLLGIDLASAPIDDIAVQLELAARRRAESAKTGAGTDEVAEAIDRLEEATRELAMERMSAALMRLDEQTRMSVLGVALSSDGEGQRMNGMLQVIARMKPASLARLLTLVATKAKSDPRRLAAALTLPPEALAMLGMMLSRSPDVAPDFGVSTTTQAEEIAHIIATEDDESETERQVAVASPTLSSGRALATATAISRVRLDADTIKAIGEVLPQSAKDGAFSTIREALRRLSEVENDASLGEAVTEARATLSEPTVLRQVCWAPVTDSDAAIAGEILMAAGPAGASALLSTYIRADEARRSLLGPILRGMSERVLAVARPEMRTADAAHAVAILRVLPVLGDARAVPLIAEMIGNLDEQVRFAAVTALASIRSPQSDAALVRALNHREPETQRHVVREIGRHRIATAVPGLSRALEDLNIFQRTYETRKDIIGALEQIATREAQKALRKYAQRSFGVGRKTRELRSRAVRAAEMLENNRGVSES
jgi:hypothetical protein